MQISRYYISVWVTKTIKARDLNKNTHTHAHTSAGQTDKAKSDNFIVKHFCLRKKNRLEDDWRCLWERTKNNVSSVKCHSHFYAMLKVSDAFSWWLDFCTWPKPKQKINDNCFSRIKRTRWTYTKFSVANHISKKGAHCQLPKKR